MVRFHVQAPNLGDGSGERAGLINRRDRADCLRREGSNPLSPTKFSKAVEVRQGAPNGLLTLLAKLIRTDSIMVNAFCS